MSDRTTCVRPPAYKRAIAGITATAIALTPQAFASRVFASGNQYTWVKHSDQDLLGGGYTGVATSASGSVQIISSAYGGEGQNLASPLYVSQDYGANWVNVTDAADHRVRDYWESVDVTDNGQTMVAVSDSTMNLDDFSTAGGKIVISHNSGSTWTDITPDTGTEWQTVAIAGNGSKIVAAARDDLSNIYVSSNGGTSWTKGAVADSVAHWSTASISDDGSKILVGGEGTNNLTSVDELSTNGGVDWTNVSPDNGDWVFAGRTGMTADGSKIFVSTYANNDNGAYGIIRESTDNGTTWTDISPPDTGSEEWGALAVSGNGSVLTAADFQNHMFISTDGGATWTPEDPGQTDGDNNSWYVADLSENGSRSIVASSSLAYSGYDAALDSTAHIPNAENGGAITLTTPDGTLITCHSGVKESGLSTQDGAYSYPLGLVDFCFSGANASNAITLVFVTPLTPSQVTVRKYNPNTQAYAAVTGATVTETTLNGQHALQVSYSVTDNGPLDTDATSGQVSDPVGLAVAAVNAPNTGLAPQNTTSALTGWFAGSLIMAGLFIAPIRRKVRYVFTPKK